MVEARRETRFAQEPFAETLVRGDSGREHLQRHLPLETNVESPVDLSGAAPPDQLLGPVTAELRRDGRMPVVHSRTSGLA